MTPRPIVDNTLVQTTDPISAAPPIDAVSQRLEWSLFAVTGVGAMIVYIALFNQSWIWFVVGEVICGSVWVCGFFYKRMRSKRLALSGHSAPATLSI